MSASGGRTYGHVGGVTTGTLFTTRVELQHAGVHGQTRAGIFGDPSEDGGAFSICMSGGYEDDRDFGERIIYVGAGGQDKDTRKQIAHQSFDDPPNKSLQVSCHTKRPVRVVRGADEYNIFSPDSGYRYDGLYVVDKAELKPGKRGFNMCFFELRRIREEGDRPIPGRTALNSKRLSQIGRALKMK